MTTDHPDWFGAGESGSGDPDDRPATDFDAEGADWFDDLDHVDPTPEEAPWSGSGPPSAASTDATASADAEAAGTTGAASSARAGENGAAGQGAAGTPHETESTTGAGSRGRRSRRRSQQDDSGGFLVWLKRLLGLN
ncbi:hypothetical protein [Haloglomus litoreum]|uniref:hypothetical protein n=1 Tax=Haloglomus litoreum TaxID=3034026 RepID=UPI0023E7C9A9|nr:hypothetical protein [Haloglomus sp. DT116]